MGATFPDGLELCWQFRIPDLIRVEIANAYRHTVFYLEGADIMQERSPAFVFGQVLSHMTGKKNVAAVAAIHHPLCRVDAASGYVGAFVHVHYTRSEEHTSELQSRGHLV